MYFKKIPISLVVQTEKNLERWLSSQKAYQLNEKARGQKPRYMAGGPAVIVPEGKYRVPKQAV